MKIEIMQTHVLTQNNFVLESNQLWYFKTAKLAQSAGSIKYTDCISSKEEDPLQLVS